MLKNIKKMAISQVRDAPASIWKQRRYYLTLPDVPAHAWRCRLQSGSGSSGKPGKCPLTWPMKVDTKWLNKANV